MTGLVLLLEKIILNDVKKYQQNQNVSNNNSFSSNGTKTYSAFLLKNNK